MTIFTRNTIGAFAAALLLGIHLGLAAAAERRALTNAQAREIALAQTGGGTVVESDIDVKRGGRVVHEFEIVNGDFRFEVEVDGATGDILEFKRKPERRRARTAPAPAAPGGLLLPQIDLEMAQTLALDRAGGGNVTEYKLERKSGRLRHELEVNNAGRRHEVKIDDATGEIVGFSIE